jgi:hypothetical protein
VWPLLTVKTEANEDLLSTNVREPSMFVLQARRAGTRDLYPSLAALVSSVQHIIFLAAHVFIICPHRPATWAGSRARSPVS